MKMFFPQLRSHFLDEMAVGSTSTKFPVAARPTHHTALNKQAHSLRVDLVSAIIDYPGSFNLMNLLAVKMKCLFF